MNSRFAAFVAALATSATSIAAQQPVMPLSSNPPDVLPYHGECQVTLGKSLPSTLGPVAVNLSVDDRGTAIRIERDQIPGHGQASGKARLSGNGGSQLFDFGHTLSNDRYAFTAVSASTDLLQFLVTTNTLTVSPLTAREEDGRGIVSLFSGSAPRFTVTLGDTVVPAAKLTACVDLLKTANKTLFCVGISPLARTDCPIASWRMAAEDTHRVDWVDETHLKRDGEAITFAVFTRRGTIENVDQPSDHTSLVTIVKGNCAAQTYSSLAILDFGEHGVDVTLNRPQDPNEPLIEKDFLIACSGRYRSLPVENPVEQSAIHFDAERAKNNERAAFPKIWGLRR